MHSHVDQLVKQTVEEMLNIMLNMEADNLYHAMLYKTFSDSAPHCGGVQGVSFENLLFRRGQIVYNQGK